jgi:GTP cyclohydrolase I
MNNKIDLYTLEETVFKSSTKKIIESLVLQIEGVDTLRPGMIETPDRVCRALDELFDGYKTNIDSLFKVFDGEGTDQIVSIKDHKTTSFCEHHCLPFEISVDVAYLPNKKAIGASKLPRLVNAYAHRFQIQERIAEQVAHTLMDKLKPKGVCVIIHGSHACMKCRGVKSDSIMVNSIMLGAFRKNQASRMEVLSLLGYKN